MTLNTRLAVGAVALVAVISAGFALVSSKDAPHGPTLSGWMKNFTPLDAPAPAPEIVLMARGNKAQNLADFRGKVVLVNFWATWCGPCIREMPTLMRLQEKLGGEAFQLVALSEDRRGWAVIDPFLKRHGLTELHAFHDPGGKTAQKLKVHGMPTTILYDRQGNERGRLAGIAEWDSDEAVALMRYYMAHPPN